MASKNNHTKTGPSALTRRVAVIEMRAKERPLGEWRLYSDFLLEPLREDSLVWTCKNLSERFTGYEFRYRAATLTFDDDGSKCTIY